MDQSPKRDLAALLPFLLPELSFFLCRTILSTPTMAGVDLLSGYALFTRGPGPLASPTHFFCLSLKYISLSHFSLGCLLSLPLEGPWPRTVWPSPQSLSYLSWKALFCP
jgi:hypothetical protein